jgi:hypothetical protein
LTDEVDIGVPPPAGTAEAGSLAAGGDAVAVDEAVPVLHTDAEVVGGFPAGVLPHDVKRITSEAGCQTFHLRYFGNVVDRCSGMWLDEGMTNNCNHGNDCHTECSVDADGRTSCCGAYSSIHMDDGVEYCKCCYGSVTGYTHTPTKRVMVNL